MDTKLYVAKGINTSYQIYEETAFIYLEDRKKLLQLNEVGSYIWECINGTLTIEKIIHKCLQIYEGDKDEIIKSIIEFLSFLFEEKMVVFSNIKFKGVMKNV